MTRITTAAGGMNRRRVLLAGSAACLSACTIASETSDAPTSPDLDGDPLAALRLPPKADLSRWAMHVPAPLLGHQPQVLALSGGGEDGTFGAGALAGWSATGLRPEFDIVTVVSTGALIASFAFHGSDHDAALDYMFLNHDADDLMQMRSLGLVYSDALYDTAPLAELLELYTPPKVLRAMPRVRGFSW